MAASSDLKPTPTPPAKPKPPFNPLDRSPTLKKLLKLRLAPVRERELIAKATCPDRPVKPAPGDCCGSSCHPCVMDNYAEELKVWRECWVKWDGDGERLEVGEVEGGTAVATVDGKKEAQERKLNIPGSFEW